MASHAPKPGSKDSGRLELFGLLVEKYEKEHFALGLPRPVEAIRFRMEQQGMAPRDLVPYLGSRSKVSEVLAGKRQLTLSMIRALHQGLGIPADVLLQETGATLPELPPDEYDRFPTKEMAARGYFPRTISDRRDQDEDLIIRDFLAQVGSPSDVSAIRRRTRCLRSGKRMDNYSLLAWCVRVQSKARNQNGIARYSPAAITPEFLVEVARLSWSDKGPVLAQEFLAKNGIALVVEPHLPKTHMDGAAMLSSDGRPVIGLTLRHDRLDNFWYTLLHELAHIQRHVLQAGDTFVDDLDYLESDDPHEREADDVAKEALIPASAQWESSQARIHKTPKTVKEFADRLRIHPAIVAGRIRHESRNCRVLGSLVGAKAVRRLFGDVEWPA